MTSLSEHCRLCLTPLTQSELISISEKNLENLLENLLRLTLLPGHDYICAGCYKKVESFNYFMNMCHNSEKLLLEEDVKVEVPLLVETAPPKTRSRGSVLEVRRKKTTRKNKKQKTRTNKKDNTSSHLIVKPEASCSSDFVISDVTSIDAPPQSISYDDFTPTFQCIKCEETFPSKVALDIHFRQHCDKNPAEKCNHCLATFKTPYELKLHTKVHVNNIVGGMKAIFQETFNENKDDS